MPEELVPSLTELSTAPHLTTEYTPTPRGEAIPRKTSVPPQVQVLQKPGIEDRSTTPPLATEDPSSLPPVTAPPSHPPINPSEPGVIEGRTIFEVDMDALAEKPWRRPGSDLSDYFNYGFDEVSWEAYCYRRRDLGEMANHLKGAVTVCT
jgi:pre-mRNA 3'-end-processing factor FIP1